MERKLFTSILSIFTALVILMTSFVLWLNFDNEEGKLIAESYGELPLSMRDNNFDTILYGNLIEEQEIQINYKNLNDTKRKEDLYLVVHIDSTINETDLTVSINGREYYIKDYKSELNDQYRCYLIDKLSFNEYEEKKLNIRLKKNIDISDNSYIIYDFQIL